MILSLRGLHLVIIPLNKVWFMNCAEKVPWMDGKPRPIINLDDPSQMFKHNIFLREGESKGDY
jgi:hypothetical protein